MITILVIIVVIIIVLTSDEVLWKFWLLWSTGHAELWHLNAGRLELFRLSRCTENCLVLSREWGNGSL